MCGILGFCFDERGGTHDEVLGDFLKTMIHSQVRGIDACGAYVVNPDGIAIFKAPGSVADNLDELAEFAASEVNKDTVAIIGHTRAATLGDPEINDNNHPIYDDPIVGVHNGVIRNHSNLGDRYGKVAEVDSAAIMGLLKSKAGAKLTVGKMTSSLDELSGPYAIAVADRRHPDSVYLARNYNPVVFTRNPERNYLAFASTSDILCDALGKVKTFSMPADTAVRIDSNVVKGKLRYKPIVKEVFEFSKPRRFSTRPAYGDYQTCPKCGQAQMYIYTSAGGGLTVHECE